jgi:hypothetical protein
MPDAYPFTLSAPVRQKLEFIHNVILDRQESASQVTGEQGASSIVV